MNEDCLYDCTTGHSCCCLDQNQKHLRTKRHFWRWTGFNEVGCFNRQHGIFDTDLWQRPNPTSVRATYLNFHQWNARHWVHWKLVPPTNSFASNENNVSIKCFEQSSNVLPASVCLSEIILDLSHVCHQHTYGSLTGLNSFAFQPSFCGADRRNHTSQLRGMSKLLFDCKLRVLSSWRSVCKQQVEELKLTGLASYAGNRKMSRSSAHFSSVEKLTRSLPNFCHNPPG